MRRRAFLLSLLALTGCAATGPLPSGVRPYREDVSLSGRLSVSYLQSGQPQSLQGKFRWQQRRDRTEIDLYSPLGQTMARITITPDRAWLQQSGGAMREAASADALTEAALGWPLPVDGLRFWLQGFIADADRRLRAVTPADTANLHSDGWRVNYVSWQDGGGYPAPRRIDFTREETRGPLSLRIVIDGWNDGN